MGGSSRQTGATSPQQKAQAQRRLADLEKAMSALEQRSAETSQVVLDLREELRMIFLAASGRKETTDESPVEPDSVELMDRRDTLPPHFATVYDAVLSCGSTLQDKEEKIKAAVAEARKEISSVKKAVDGLSEEIVRASERKDEERARKDEERERIELEAGAYQRAAYHHDMPGMAGRGRTAREAEDPLVEAARLKGELDGIFETFKDEFAEALSEIASHAVNIDKLFESASETLREAADQARIAERPSASEKTNPLPLILSGAAALFSVLTFAMQLIGG